MENNPIGSSEQGLTADACSDVGGSSPTVPVSRDSTGDNGSTLFEQCADMAESVRHAVDLAGGAAYLVGPAMIYANVERLLGSLRQSYANAVVAYSYKTNYNRVLVEAARRAGALSEVVSGTELAYAQRLGVPDSELVFNGPGKTSRVLRDAMARDITLIADSVEELRRLAKLVDEGVPLRARLGLRVAPRLSFVSAATRFGVNLERETTRCEVQRLVRDHGLPISGVHLHTTADRSLDSYRERLDYLAGVWESLDIGQPAFLDLGGGYAGAMPAEIRDQLTYNVATLEEYGASLGQRMHSWYPDGNVELICEPGIGILSDVGVFATPVVDVKQDGDRAMAVVDGTTFCVNPLRSPGQPSVLRLTGVAASSSDATVSGAVSVYGNSCMEVDLLVEAYQGELAIGDVLVFAQKGAYAACMASPFIQGVPALVSIDDTNGAIRLERARTGVDEFLELN